MSTVIKKFIPAVAKIIFVCYNQDMYKLNFEMVPEECWYKNLRSFLPPAKWDIIRRDAYRRAGGRCMICGLPCRRLEAHERWEYDEEKHVQKLADVLAICRDCHSVIHISRAYLVGDGDRAMEHFIKVNRCTVSDFHLALAAANEEYLRRNKIEDWTTDISFIYTIKGIEK